MNYKTGLLSVALLLVPTSYVAAQEYAVDDIGTHLVAWEQARAHDGAMAKHGVLTLLFHVLGHHHDICGKFGLFKRLAWSEGKLLATEALDLNNVVNISINDINLLNADQLLELLRVASAHAHKHDAFGATATAVGETYIREQVLAALLWLLQQSNVEGLLPASVTQSEFYISLRNELGRYGLDEAAVHVHNAIAAHRHNHSSPAAAVSSVGAKVAHEAEGLAHKVEGIFHKNK